MRGNCRKRGSSLATGQLTQISPFSARPRPLRGSPTIIRWPPDRVHSVVSSVTRGCPIMTDIAKAGVYHRYCEENAPRQAAVQGQQTPPAFPASVNKPIARGAVPAERRKDSHSSPMRRLVQTFRDETREPVTRHGSAFSHRHSPAQLGGRPDEMARMLLQPPGTLAARGP